MLKVSRHNVLTVHSSLDIMQECLLLGLALAPVSLAQELSTLASVDITPLFEGLSEQQQKTQFNFQPQPAVPGLQVTPAPAPATTPRPVRIRVQKEEIVTAKPELPQGISDHFLVIECDLDI